MMGSSRWWKQQSCHTLKKTNCFWSFFCQMSDRNKWYSWWGVLRWVLALKKIFSGDCCNDTGTTPKNTFSLKKKYSCITESCRIRQHKRDVWFTQRFFVIWACSSCHPRLLDSTNNLSWIYLLRASSGPLLLLLLLFLLQLLLSLSP